MLIRFIACQQRLVLSGDEETITRLERDEFWDRLFALSDDMIPGVRIGLARLVGIVMGELWNCVFDKFHLTSGDLLIGGCLRTDKFYRDSPHQLTSRPLRDIVDKLSRDRVEEVRAYVLAGGAKAPMAGTGPFSRPPPTYIVSAWEEAVPSS